MTDPLPMCPFCGCSEIATEERKVGGKPFRASYWYETACGACGANTTGGTAEEAENKWRKRTP